jgi:hypothetical protein
MGWRIIEDVVNEIEVIRSLVLDEVSDLFDDLLYLPESDLFAFQKRVGAVDTRERATPFGLKIKHSSFPEIALTLEERAFRGETHWGPGPFDFRGDRFPFDEKRGEERGGFFPFERFHQFHHDLLSLSNNPKIHIQLIEEFLRGEGEP